MAFPSIEADAGTIDFIELNGELNAQAVRLRAIERPGIDGTAFRELGQKSVPSTIIGTRDILNETQLVTMKAALMALQGEKVTVNLKRRTGLETTTNVYIESAQIASVVGMGASSGGVETDGEFLLNVQFVMRTTNTV